MSETIPVGTHIWPVYARTSPGIIGPLSAVPDYCSKRIDALKCMSFDGSQVEALPATHAFSRFHEMNVLPSKLHEFLFVRFPAPATPPGASREAIGVIVDRRRCITDFGNLPVDTLLPATPPATSNTTLYSPTAAPTGWVPGRRGRRRRSGRSQGQSPSAPTQRISSLNKFDSAAATQDLINLVTKYIPHGRYSANLNSVITELLIQMEEEFSQTHTLSNKP